MNLQEILAAIQAGNFADLTDEQIAEGRAAIRDALVAHRSGEQTVEADEFAVLVESGRALVTEATTREAAASEAAEADAELDDLVAGLSDPDPEPEPGRPSVAEIASRRPAQVTPDPDPEPETEPQSVLVAASGFAGSDAEDAGERLESISDLGQRMLTVHRAYSTPDAGRVMPRIARHAWSNSVATLVPNSDEGSVMEVFARAQAEGQRRARAAIDAGFNPQVLQAASGICGPTEPRYDVYTIGSATAGVIDLPMVNLARGKVSYPDPLTYDSLRETDGIAYKYTSDDGSGIHGDVVKDCYTVSCGTNREFELAAFQTCLKFSNFQGKFNPEWVGHVTTQSLMTHSHIVNKDLIGSLVADTRTVDYGTTDFGGGAIVNFTRDLAFHTMLYRDKYRLAQNEVLDVVVPFPVLSALLVDGITRPDGLFTGGNVASVISRIQAEHNARVQFVYDWTGFEAVANPGGFGDQTYNMLVYPAGSVFHISSETLDLGEVRDSTYNSRNEFGTWVETFDGIASIGPEVIQVTGGVYCPSGQVGAGNASIVCTAGTGSS